MKNTCFFLGLIFLCFACRPTPTCETDLKFKSNIAYLNQSDSDPFSGLIACFFDNGTPSIKGSYLNGNRHGQFSFWFPSGLIEKEERYVKGKLDGLKCTWYEDGKLKLSETYLKSNLHGESLSWFPSGQKSSEEFYKNGEPHGRFLEWHEDGKPKTEKIFVNGKLDGVSKSWFSSGQQASEAFFKDDVIDGKNLKWFENGKAKLAQSFNNGIPDGASISWYENGQKASKIFLKNGQKSGICSTWDKNGKATSRTRYYNGKTLEDIEDEFINLILSNQARYVFDSYGKWASECVTWNDLAIFKSNKIPASVSSSLKENPSFKSLILSLKNLPSAKWQSIRSKGLQTYEPTWEQVGHVSRDAQSVAGQVEESLIAQAVVEAADALMKKSINSLQP